jgi:hypothetical protein
VWGGRAGGSPPLCPRIAGRVGTGEEGIAKGDPGGTRPRARGCMRLSPSWQTYDCRSIKENRARAERARERTLCARGGCAPRRGAGARRRAWPRARGHPLGRLLRNGACKVLAWGEAGIALAIGVGGGPPSRALGSPTQEACRCYS